MAWWGWAIPPTPKRAQPGWSSTQDVPGMFPILPQGHGLILGDAASPGSSDTRAQGGEHTPGRQHQEQLEQLQKLGVSVMGMAP